MESEANQTVLLTDEGAGHALHMEVRLQKEEGNAHLSSGSQPRYSTHPASTHNQSHLI